MMIRESEGIRSDTQVGVYCYLEDRELHVAWTRESGSLSGLSTAHHGAVLSRIGNIRIVTCNILKRDKLLG